MVGESRGRTKDDGRNRGDEESRLEEDRRLYKSPKGESAGLGCFKILVCCQAFRVKNLGLPKLGSFHNSLLSGAGES